MRYLSLSEALVIVDSGQGQSLLRRAFTIALGPRLGAEALSDALLYLVEHRPGSGDGQPLARVTRATYGPAVVGERRRNGGAAQESDGIYVVGVLSGRLPDSRNVAWSGGGWRVPGGRLRFKSIMRPIGTSLRFVISRRDRLAGVVGVVVIVGVALSYWVHLDAVGRAVTVALLACAYGSGYHLKTEVTLGCDGVLQWRSPLSPRRKAPLGDLRAVERGRYGMGILRFEATVVRIAGARSTAFDDLVGELTTIKPTIRVDLYPLVAGDRSSERGPALERRTCEDAREEQAN